jgi:hypothetical protein
MDQSPNSIALKSGTTNSGPALQRKLTQWIIRWLLFFLICMGLGYASVERYQPRNTPGLTDTALYYRLVAGDEVQGRELRFRVLVPYVARPFYLLSRKFLDQQAAVNLALLIANSIFCATTACLLVSAGILLAHNLAVALFAACLYLLNFAIANLQLAGMIDAGEACFMMAVTWALLFDRWWLLPVCGLFGALAKETFVPLAGLFTLAWWFCDQRKKQHSASRLIWAIAMVVIGMLTLIAARLSFIAGGTGGITIVAGGLAAGGIEFQNNPDPSYFSRLLSTFSSRTFWYLFVWLLPFGALGLRRLPRAWVIASIVAALGALTLGLYKNIGGNVARPIFDVAGPMLSLSAAIWLSRMVDARKSLPVD